MEKYEDKFAALIKLCENLKRGDAIYIAMPQALGDNYEELIESLNRIADAEGRLVIVPRKDRDRVNEEHRHN